MPVKTYVSPDKTKQFVLFYKFDCVFSNFYPCEFSVQEFENDVEKSIQFNCSEQYFMYHKALLVKDSEIAGKILNETDPRKMKRLGRQLSMSKKQLEIWSQKSREVMYNGCLEKFSQNVACRENLFRTHGMRLVEASPMDRIWGIGLSHHDNRCENEETWRGTNWMGIVLDKIREELWTKPEYRQLRLEIEKESVEMRCQKVEEAFSH